MRDCVVIGCGRSGTSLAAGILSRSGYDPGAGVLPPDRGGPTGFFEARAVNRINETLLARHDDRFLHTAGYSRPLRPGERWLAVLPADAEIAPPPQELRAAMRSAKPSSPYCCKDPRFGYTLPSWRPLFDGALYLCVFRHPVATARSISGEVRYGDLTVKIDTAFEIWKAVYARVLERHTREGQWLFVHYEQLLDGSALDRLSRALDAALDSSIVNPALYRSRPDGAAPHEAQDLYEELCALAEYAA
jgi:hypothetical protein